MELPHMDPKHTWINVSIHLQICICVQICIYLCNYSSIYLCLHIYIYIRNMNRSDMCMICIHIYIHYLHYITLHCISLHYIPVQDRTEKYMHALHTYILLLLFILVLSMYMYIYSLVPASGTAQTWIRLVKLVHSVTKFSCGINKFH